MSNFRHTTLDYPHKPPVPYEQDIHTRGPMGIISRIRQAIKRPMPGRIATPRLIDARTDYSSATDLTPVRLTRVLRQADTGHMEGLVDLATAMEEREGHLSGVLQTRKLAVAGVEWDIVPGDKTPEAQRIAEEADAMLRELPFLTPDSPLGGSGFEVALLDLLDGLLKGYATHEIEWDTSSGQAVPVALHWVQQRRLRFNMGRNTSPIGEMRLLTEEEPANGILIPPHKMILHAPRSRSGWTCRAGLVRVLSWMYLFKNYAIKDWAVYTEIHGTPYRVGRYEQGTPDEEINALKDELVAMGTDGAAVISKFSEIEFLTASGAAGPDVYGPFLNYLDSTVSKAVLGHAGSSDATPGRLGGEQSADNVRQDLRVADASALCATIRRDLLAPWVLFNRGEKAPVPYLHLRVEEDADLNAGATRVKTLSDAGLAIPASWVYETFSIPAPAKGEPTLARQPSPNQPPPPARARLTAGAQEAEPDLDGAEAYTQGALDEAPAAMRPILRAITEAIDKAETLDEAVLNLATVESDVSRLGDLLHRTKFACRLLGMAEVWDETREDDEEAEAAEQLDLWAPRKRRAPAPSRAIAEFSERIAEPYESYRLLSDRDRRKAFSLAYQANEFIVMEVQDRLKAALAEGETLEEFRGNLKATYDRIGITEVSPHHTETVFRNANQTSYNAGHWGTMRQPTVMALRPYWQYRGIGDDRQRDEHAEMDGKVYRADDPIWDQWYPPNGHNCRCSVVTLSARQVERRGLTVQTETPEVTPDEGWAVPPTAME